MALLELTQSNILTGGWHDDERSSGATLFEISSVILRPRVSILESRRDQCQRAQRLPHSHIVSKNTTTQFVWLVGRLRVRQLVSITCHC